MTRFGAVLSRRLFVLAVVAVLLLPLSLADTGTTSADRGARDYQWLIGAGPLCDLPVPDPCPTIAGAPNGDTLEVTGEGTFSIHPKDASGGGEFVHKNSDGEVLAEGTWEATKVLGFHSYGNGVPQGLPEAFEGGLLLMRVELFVEDEFVTSGVIKVTCVVGDKIPASAHEGVRVNARGINFNEELSGLTLYIRQ